MRIVFVGASELAVMTAKLLVERNHEIIVVESKKERIEALSEDLDCSFLHGDGTRPAILKEVDPKSTQVLFCLTNNDQTNLIAGLVGRSLGFEKVVTSIQDPEFENIGYELGLEHVIVPNQMISRLLVDMIRGVDILELSTAIKGEARVFTFVVDKKNAGSVKDLNLPGETALACYYRENHFFLADEDTKLRPGDEVVLLTTSKNISGLKKKFYPENIKKG